MKKMTAIISIVILLINLFSLSISAVSESYHDVYDNKEFEHIKKIIVKDELNREESILKQSDDTSVETNNNNGQPLEVATMSPYKLFYMTPDDFTSFRGSKSEIQNLANTSYNWIMPTDIGCKITLSKVDDEWEVVDHSTVSENSDVIEINKYISYNDNAQEKLLDGSQYENAICFHITPYRTSFLCYTDNEGVYLVPYSSRPDFTGLVNGKTYEIDKAKEILCTAFCENQDINQSDSKLIYCSGLGAIVHSNSNYVLLLIIAVPIVLAVGFVFMFLAKGRKNDEKV